MSKRKAEDFTALVAGYGSDDDDDSENEGSEGGSGPGNLLLGGYHDEDEAGDTTSPRAGPSDQPTGQQASVAETDEDMDLDAENTNRRDQAAERSQPGETTAGANLPLEAAAKPPHEADPDYQILPPELREPPPGEPPLELKVKLSKMMRMQETDGRTLTGELKGSRDYQNPDFLRKIVEHFEIRERGSCLPKEVFDPDGLPAEDHVKELRREWEMQEARRRVRAEARRREAGAPMEFRQAGVQVPAVLNPGLHAQSLSSARAIAGQAPQQSMQSARAMAQAKASAALQAAKKSSKWDLARQ